MNCSIQPMTNKASAMRHNPKTKKQNGIIKIESAIIGMPMLWVSLFIGCSWLCEYSSIQSSQLLPPIIVLGLRLRKILLPFVPAVKGLDHEAFVDRFMAGQFEIVEKLNGHEHISILDRLGYSRDDPALDLILKSFEHAGTADDKDVPLETFGAFEDLLFRVTKNDAVREIGLLRMTQNHVCPVGQRSSDRTPRVRAHDDDTAGGRLFEIL